MEAEVVKPEAERLESEKMFQNNRFSYYLPLRFQGLETGGHVLGIYRVWVRGVYPSPRTDREGNTPFRLKELRILYDERFRQYEEILSDICYGAD